MKTSSLGSTVLVGSTVFGLTLSYFLANSENAGRSARTVTTPRRHPPLDLDYRRVKLASNPTSVPNSEYQSIKLSASFDETDNKSLLRKIRLRGLDKSAGETYPFGLSVERDFVPIGWDEERSTMEVVYNNTLPNPMSRFLHSAKKEEEVEVREVRAAGATDSFAQLRRAKQIGFIVAGEGLAPALQYLRMRIRGGKYSDDDDGDDDDPPRKRERRISLLISNRTPDSILGKDRLEEYTKALPSEILTVTHTFTRSDKNRNEAKKRWRVESGRVDTEMIKRSSMPPAALRGEAIIVVCGPRGFVESIVRCLKGELGYEDGQLVRWVL